MSWCTCDVFAFGLSLLLDIQGRTESRISILFLRIFLLLRVLKHVLQADLFPNQMEMSLQKLNGQPEHVCGDSNVSFGMVPFFLGELRKCLGSGACRLRQSHGTPWNTTGPPLGPAYQRRLGDRREEENNVN